MSIDDSDKDILEQAALWEVRLNDPGQPLAEAELSRFQDWLLASERHQKAFRSINGVAGLAAEIPPAESARLKHWAAENAGDRAASRRQFLKWGALAASMVGLLVFGGFLAKERGLFAQSWAAGIGETRTVTFEDGSVAYLNTRTEVRWLGNDHDRRVALISGQALFDVVHDANRPFRVMLADSEIQVRGTRFNVYRKTSGDTVVTVLEGSVEVRGYGSGPTHPEWVRILHADQKIDYRAIGLMHEPSETVAQNAVKWRNGFIQFEDTPVPEVVEELMRYTNQKIVIRDPRIAVKRVGGALGTVDVRKSLEHLRVLDIPVQVRESDGVLTLEYDATADTTSAQP